MSPETRSGPEPVRLAVVGAGAWGSVLAWLLARRGHRVTLWMRDPARAARWDLDRIDPAGRAPVALPDGATPTASLALALDEVAGAFLALPTSALDETLTLLRPTLPAGAPLVSCAKGLFAPDLTRPARRVELALPTSPVAVLSGPNLAGEIAAELPAAATVAGRDPHVAQLVQGWIASERFRVYTADDPIGVEVAGAYKNVIALAAGMADGLDLGENAKAALITRGLSEMVRLGRHLGGHERTFYGLAGVGDLVATCASRASRNHAAGERLARGETVATLRQEGLTAEGLATVRAVDAYAERHGLSLPIAEQVAAVAFADRAADQALAALLARDPRDEFEARRR
jgi:glycerol-3-phosphate dehydrogenase (NAD(P)+)